MSRLARLALALALLGLFVLAPQVGSARAQICTGGNGATVCTDTMPLDVTYDTGISCGTFDIIEHDIGTVTERDFFDKSGTPTMSMLDLQQPVGAGSTSSNSVTGLSLPISVHEHLRFSDFDASTGDFQEVSGSGTFIMSTLPGVGLVFHQSGHFAIGPSGVMQESHLVTQAAFEQAVGAACSALS